MKKLQVVNSFSRRTLILNRMYFLVKIESRNSAITLIVVKKKTCNPSKCNYIREREITPMESKRRADLEPVHHDDDGDSLL